VLRSLVLAIAAIFRPKALLIAENLRLRQQLVVLAASTASLERRRSALLDPGERMVQRLAASVADCEPETVLGWQRAGWRPYWRWRSSHKERGGRPAIAVELQALIARMAAENRLWGQKRIQAELARLGFQVSARTVAKYMRVSPPGPDRDMARVPDAARIEHVGLRLFLRPDGPVPDASRLLRHPARE
jgi:putative transposase